jgi:hypothetical protein
MKVTITINMDNAAFDEEPRYELARILGGLSSTIELFGIESVSQDPILDINGNRVGSLSLTEDERPA